jgi:CRISPR/Cas system-associated endoribonuclease Cas2
MPLYLVSYDISEKDAFEYDARWEKLKQIQAERILYSGWVVSGTSATNIYDQIAPLIQMKDRVLVQGLTQEATWDKLMISDEDFTSLLNGGN